MRRLILVGACVALLGMSTAQAHITPVVAASLMPSPLGIALTVGKWIWDASTREQVYYIVVAGDGRTVTEARNNGFRLAVESALGSVISSETEVVNGRIVRDEIISYAAGFVERFELVETTTTANGYTVAMKVWIRRSALANRLLNRSEQSGQVNGAQASVQIQTLGQERATGDRLLQTVLNDFPKRAFDIELKPTEVLHQNRTAYMEVNFQLGWNADYLRSLWTALEATSQKTSRPQAVITVGSGGWFKGFGGEARFDDTGKLALLTDRMYMSGPAVLVTVRGAQRQTLYSACYMYQELDNVAHYVVTNQRFVEFGAHGARINGGYRMNGRVQIPINNAVLQHATTVDMDVVLRNQCPNR
jgi:hypothetical protein